MVNLMLMSLKGIASTNLTSDVGINSKSEWQLGQRIRVILANVYDRYCGDRSRSTRPTSVVRQGISILDRDTEQVRAEVVDDTKKDELHGYLEENVLSDAMVYLDRLHGHDDLPQLQEVVLHGARELVRSYFHTNGIASF